MKKKKTFLPVRYGFLELEEMFTRLTSIKNACLVYIRNR